MYSFEKLQVWKESVVLIKTVYALVVRLPANEKNNASDQLRRAAFSISLNIAEGSGADSDKELIRYLFIARKSLYEVVSIVKIVEEIYSIKGDLVLSQANKVGKLLNGLIRSLKDKK